MKPKCCINKELTAEYANLARFLRVIGDDNRWRILCLLQGGERCVCEIFPNLGLSQNLVSSHLKVMRDFGLLSLRQEGKKNYYSIDKKTVKRYGLSLSRFLKAL